ncbi:uroporphyrinogen-III synthase [Malassezia brasiliensis]|uniref:Uroporphyrinogen-III synthase n=1 Tax=Malassezia brasiliensis TaxID=1821822 RepID=A0AAF0DRV6_9BASI|nr:uroporphyrinogen-III synthase [Malassezia brasiliensis]
MTHHLSTDDDSREYWIVSYPILSHRLENIQALADRILHAVENKVSYDGVVITSKRAVQAWVEACKQVASIMQERPDSGMDSERIWSTVPYYVVGPATAKALNSALLAPMLRPREVIGASDTGTGAALAQCMAERFAAQNVTQPQRLLYLVGSKHSLSLQETLEELKAPVELDELCVYSTEKDTNFEYHCRLLSNELPHADGMQSMHKMSPHVGRHNNLKLTELDHDEDMLSPTDSHFAVTPPSHGQAPKWIVFFSPSGGDYALSDLEAYNWVRKPKADKEKSMPKIACIGTTTASWVRERLGVEPDAIAGRPTPDALRDAIVNSERAE